jgi:hypothetical protein
MKDIERKDAATAPATQSAEQAWELVGLGRYRPRRIRGSFHGRELG